MFFKCFFNGECSIVTKVVIKWFAKKYFMLIFLNFLDASNHFIFAIKSGYVKTMPKLKKTLYKCSPKSFRYLVLKVEFVYINI